MKQFVPFILAALMALPAFAQDKAAAPAAAAAAPVAAPVLPPINVAKHSCVKPAALNAKSDNDAKTKFNTDIKVYRECLQAYAGEMQRTSQAHIAAGNTAINEFNTFVNEMKEITTPPADAAKK